MRIRPGPLVALLLLAGLGAWVYLEEFRGAEERRLAEERRTRPLPFERSELRALTLTNEHGRVRLEKSGEEFRLVEPLPCAVDREALESLLTSVEIARIERRLGPQSDLARYGLDPPRATLAIEVSGEAAGATLAIGEGSPIGGTYFALLPGGEGVAVVSGSIGSAAEKSFFNLRDKSLLAFDPWKITRLRIERGRETILLEKPSDGWKLARPVEAPADGPTITDLLSALERLRASEFVLESADAAALKRYGLEPPAARVTLLQEGWDVEKTVVFGRKGEADLYARAVGRDPILKIPADFWDKLATRVIDLRRKDLLGVSRYRIEQITAARGFGPALVLSRQEDGSWSVSGPASGSVKDAAVDRLLRLVSDMRALSFEDAPGEDLLASLAGHPALDLVLEERSEGDDGTGRSQHLVVGAPDRAGRIRVRDMAWRPVAVVDGGILERMDKQLDAIVKEAEAPPAIPTEPAPEGPAGPDEEPPEEAG
ncbi:MAG: DUF4340 domain-containing protein [Acidobacteriota bacterium]